VLVGYIKLPLSIVYKSIYQLSYVIREGMAFEEDGSIFTREIK